MNKFTEKVYNTLKRAGLSFSHYPASMGFATLMSVLAIWLIYKNPDETKIYESLLLAFALGIFAGIAFVVIAEKISRKRMYFIGANLDAVLVAAITFFVLYFPKEREIKEIEMFRVLAAIIVFFLLFISIPTLKGNLPDFNKMFFMTLKSFFISLVYGLVLMLGFFFVAFAVQSLLYEDMTEKIYAYIAILSGLVAYAFFLGYFPKFDNITDEGKAKIESAGVQPKFAKVLFQNILLPIMGALTVVLFIWSLRILITGEWPEYNQIIAIFTTYSLTGIVLYYLTTSFDNLIVKIYKRIFPIMAIVFLVFEFFPIWERIKYYGVKPFEYGIILVWIFSVLSCVIFIILPIVKNKLTAFIAMILVALFVLPIIGAYDFSHRSQSGHLKRILEQNEMFDGKNIVPAFEISDEDKVRITSSVEYLYYRSDKKQPVFLEESLNSMQYFRQTFGFEPAYDSDSQIPDGPKDFTQFAIFSPKAVPIEIKGYDYYIPYSIFANFSKTVIETGKGKFEIIYGISSGKDETDKYPELTISFEGEVILTDTLEEFSNTLRSTYPDAFSDRPDTTLLSTEDISAFFENSHLIASILFNSISLAENDEESSYFEVSGIYISFK